MFYGLPCLPLPVSVKISKWQLRDASKKRDCTSVAATHTIVYQQVASSIGVSKLGQTQLIFVVDPAVKINGAYYHDVLLTQQLLPVVQEIS